jgi:flagellar hook-associated protein 1 FlgK
MSLSGIMNSAVSGLTTAQTQIQVTSENVTNVDTPGYIRKIADQVSSVSGGVGTGVDIKDIRLATNSFLESAARKASSASGAADVLSQYYDQVQQLFGDPTASTSFFSSISTAFASFSSLAQNPTSVPYRQQSISDVQQVLSQASSIYSGIQSVRASADSQISSDVTQVNSLLSQIEKLNTQIAAGNVNGQDTSAEQDNQQQLVGQLSSLMNIQVASRQGGGVTVRTQDGLILAGDGAATLSYTPTGTVTGQTAFNQITLTPPGGVAVDMSQHVSSGEIAGLLQLRDVQAPQAAQQLGELTSQVADQLNKAANASSAFPPPQTLTGTSVGLDLPSAVSGFTGKTNIVVTDSSGVIQHTVAIDFGAGTMTVDGGGSSSFGPNSFLGTLQSALGSVGGSASFTNGQLSISAGSGQGIAVADDPTTPSSNGGRGFSWYFGLNNIVQSSGVANYQTGLTTSSANNFAGGQVSFSLSAGPGTQTSKVTVNIPNGGSMSDVLTALNDSSTGLGQYGSFSLDSNGQLTFTSSQTPAATLSVTSDTTSWANGPSLTQLFGVTQGARADRATSFSIRPSILQNPSTLPLASINLSAAAGTPAISAGDGTGAQLMANAGQATTTFMAAGADPGGTNSITNYASNFAGAIGQQAQQNTSNKTQADSMQTAASSRLSSYEGVNLDTELTNLQTYQQAYNASARLLQAEQDIFNALIATVQNG